jgi:hypothetical protein
MANQNFGNFFSNNLNESIQCKNRIIMKPTEICILTEKKNSFEKPTWKVHKYVESIIRQRMFELKQRKFLRLPCLFIYILFVKYAFIQNPGSKFKKHPKLNTIYFHNFFKLIFLNVFKSLYITILIPKRKKDLTVNIQYILRLEVRNII